VPGRSGTTGSRAIPWETGLAALRFPGVSSVQFTLNLLERRAVDALLPASACEGGRLHRPGVPRERTPRQAGRRDRHQGLLPTVDEQKTREEQLAKYRRVAEESNRPLARLALEYVGGVEGVSVSLLGARSVDQLRGLLGHLR